MNHLPSHFTKFIKQFQHFLFPQICGICHQNSQVGETVCQACRPFLPWAQDRCYRCGARKEHSDQDSTPINPSLHCSKCEHCPPLFDRLCAVFSYDSPISELILRLKFKRKLHAGTVVGDLLSESILSWYQTAALPQAIIPVPLHPLRLRQRGYNQCLEILKPCRKLLKQYEIPILESSCIRVRHTEPQAFLNSEKRNRNLQRAFQVCKKINYRHVAIVDDVVTTGATANALTKALKKSGIETVDVWCVCRD